MEENIKLFGKLIKHPEQIIEVLKEKSGWLLIALLLINGLLLGILYGISHFIISVLEVLFWVFAFVLGFITLILILGIFLGLNYVISKLLKEESKESNIKVKGLLFLMAFTLYNLISLPIIIVFIRAHDYYLAVYYYDLSHLVLLFWIASLCVLGTQNDNEITNYVKIFTSLFTAYGCTTIFYLEVGKLLVMFVAR